MKVENKENNRKIQQVAATMAIEDMYMVLCQDLVQVKMRNFFPF